MKVLIVSTYRFDLEDSLNKIVCGGFEALGCEVACVNVDDKKYESIANEKYDFVFIITQPKKLEPAVKNITNNKIIVWNLEPLSRSPEYDEALCWASKQHNVIGIYSYYEHEKYSFLPIGFSEKINSFQDKTIFNKIGFVGLVGEKRKRQIDYLKNIGIKVDTWDKCREIGGSAKFIGKYSVGLDIEEFPEQEEKYRWHRLMIYTANGTVFVSTTDWSKYGMENGKDFAYIKTVGDVKKWAKILLKNSKIAKEMSLNMKEKLIKNYNMTDLLRKVLI